MIKKFLLIILLYFFCIYCGIKSDPEYQDKINYNKVILTI